eukprot:3676276-Rhodomonas_salina.1
MVHTLEGHTRGISDGTADQMATFCFRTSQSTLPSLLPQCYNTMAENLLRANDIILAEEAAVYAECIRLNPSLPWKKYRLDLFSSDSDSDNELDSSLRSEMEKQVHISVLESSSTARAHAEKWGDSVWDEMKFSFTLNSRLHMMEECAHLQCRLHYCI